MNVKTYIDRSTMSLAAALNLSDMSDNLMAHQKALYHGHAVAAIAATSLDAARAASKLVNVTYEVLEPVCSIERAIAPGAPMGGAPGRIIVEATSVQVCYDYELKRSLPVPAELRRRMEAFEGRTLAREGSS